MTLWEMSISDLEVHIDCKQTIIGVPKEWGSQLAEVEAMSIERGSNKPDYGLGLRHAARKSLKSLTLFSHRSAAGQKLHPLGR
jgi:hypothetical protein